jgi:hypothetical protein
VSWLEQFRPDGKPASPVPPADPFDAVRAGGQGYARAALDGETDKVMNAANGTRNHTLNAAAFSLSQLIARGGPARRTRRPGDRTHHPVRARRRREAATDPTGPG